MLHIYTASSFMIVLIIRLNGDYIYPTRSKI